MNEQEIIDNNTMIADFMNWQHHEDTKYDAHEMTTLKYHTSWDWLMPVYKKVRQTHKSNYDASKPDIFIDIMMYLTGSILECDIEATHEAIVKFITFYNSKTSTNEQ